MIKKGKLATFFIVVIALLVLIGTTSSWLLKDTKLGLDLKGGFEVLYEVQPLKEGDVIDQNAMSATLTAIENRVNVLGVSEPDIRIEGNNRIRVQLAGVKDQTEARQILSSTAQLSFRDINDKLLLDGSDLKAKGAKVGYDPNTNELLVELTMKSKQKFYEVTQKVSQMQAPENSLVIWLDYEKDDTYEKEIQKKNSKIVSDASVTQPINSDKAIISGGDIDAEYGKQLSSILNAGALPVKLEEIYTTSVSAAFGQEA
ncbi:SecDF P1 head subdomain-containing protein, partial [Exiguobacterium sp.]|uniref:SecDF P1 head subdomain-containing protein n=1 Tax=Exiguobacterium sp. TaxID=44751 RepID=UPI0037C0090F